MFTLLIEIDEKTPGPPTITIFYAPPLSIGAL